MVAPIAHNTQQIFDWLICHIQEFLLVKTFFTISQPISNLTQQSLNHMHFLNLHIDLASHILYVNL